MVSVSFKHKKKTAFQAERLEAAGRRSLSPHAARCSEQHWHAAAGEGGKRCLPTAVPVFFGGSPHPKPGSGLSWSLGAARPVRNWALPQPGQLGPSYSPVHSPRWRKVGPSQPTSPFLPQQHPGFCTQLSQLFPTSAAATTFSAGLAFFWGGEVFAVCSGSRF